MTEYTKRVNKSYSKNFSKRAILPLFIALTYPKKYTILDYGAGKDAFGTRLLRERGFKCTAHEIGDNVLGIHYREALRFYYDVVFASNVMNVQSNREEINEIFLDVIDCLPHGGDFVFNYPPKPRYSSLSLGEIIVLAQVWFQSVTVEKFNGHRIIVCRGRNECS